MTDRKICTKCKEEKSFSEFGKNRRTPDGLQWQCKSCRYSYAAEWRDRNREKVRAGNRENKLKNGHNWKKSPQRKYALKRLYGLSIEDFESILDSQDYRCAICRTDKPSRGQWTVDHDHSCCPGEKTCGQCIRQILCHQCNRALGLLGDDIDILLAAAAYLDRHHARIRAA